MYATHTLCGQNADLFGVKLPVHEVSFMLYRDNAYRLYETFLVSYTRGDAAVWGTELQAGRSRVRFPMVLLVILINIILPAAPWPWGWLSLQQKWVLGISPRGWRRPVCRAVKLTTFVCRLSWNLRASNSCNPQGLPRPITRIFSYISYLTKANRNNKVSTAVCYLCNTDSTATVLTQP
jgi:hypothetical protein